MRCSLSPARCQVCLRLDCYRSARASERPFSPQNTAGRKGNLQPREPQTRQIGGWSTPIAHHKLSDSTPDSTPDSPLLALQSTSPRDPSRFIAVVYSPRNESTVRCDRGVEGAEPTNAAWISPAKAWDDRLPVVGPPWDHLP